MSTSWNGNGNGQPLDKPIAVYYEHPDWFRPLFAELDRRGIPVVKINARQHTYSPAAGRSAGGRTVWRYSGWRSIRVT